MGTYFSFLCKKYEQYEFNKMFQRQSQKTQRSLVKELSLQNAITNMDFLEKLIVDCQVLNLSCNNFKNPVGLTKMNLDGVLILKLRKNSISSLQFLKGQHFNRLVTLDLEDNRLTSLENIQYADLNSIKQLVLKRNRITDLTGIQKSNMSSLCFLSLDHNQISSLKPFRRCNQLTNLHFIYLSDNELHDITEIVPIATALKCLSAIRLDKNSICLSQKILLRSLKLHNSRRLAISLYF